MPRHDRLLSALLASCVLLGCAGTAEPGPEPLLPEPPPSAPGDAGLLPDGAALDDLGGGDGGTALDGALPPDGAPCAVVIPPGRYKGDLSGDAAGKIIFDIVAGPAVGAGKLKLTQPKEATYPLTLGGLDCDQLHAAIAAPVGATGGTALRGSIAARFKASQLFAGSWTMPFGSGTFKAALQP